MKKGWFIVLVGIMLLASPIIAMETNLSEGSLFASQTQPQYQVQKQDRDQVNINSIDQDWARLQLKNKIHITDDAVLQLQERMRLQKQEQEPCFADVGEHWAHGQIQMAFMWGLIQGYPDGNFRPNQLISGPEGVIMVSRLVGYLEGVEETSPEPDRINWDLVPTWARETMREATALRIANQNAFYSDTQLNRLQFAVMLAKSLGMGQEEIPADFPEYIDQDQIPAENLRYVNALRLLGIVSGNNGYFLPNQAINRSETAAMLTNVLYALTKSIDPVTLHEGTLVITLQENPSTGYLWVYTMDQEGIIELVDDLFITQPSGEMVVGAGGLQKWIFEGVKEGNVQLEFTYYRPWEGVTAAIETLSITVAVNADGWISRIE